MTDVFRAVVIALVALLPIGAEAQTAKSFRARLSPVPMDLTMAATIGGSGSMNATLNGSKLTITGTFEGLKSPATVARLHKGQRGVRGEPIFELTVTKAASGTITANLDLTPQQVLDLQQMRLYVQLSSEKAPDGNLWGWLLPQESKR
jgi:CHRD domain-containing protein